MPKRTFEGEFLRNIVWGELEEPIEILSNEITGKSRWSDIHTMVFRFEDKLYEVDYRQGSNESSEEQPFEYEDNVQCTEVEPYEVTVTKYRKVED